MAEAATARALVFNPAQTRRLSEIYAPCFTLILHLRGAPYAGDPDVLRRRIKDLLDRAARDARETASDEDIRMATFALVVFIDEAVLSSEWPGKQHWLASPLQMELYDRFDGGEAFFTRLDRLREEPGVRAEVLEIYYLCMALGFKGKYRLENQEELRIRIEDTYATLRRVPGMGPGELAPHGRPRDQLAAEVKTKLPTWVVVVCAVAIGLFFYVGLRFSITNVAQENAAAIGAAAQVETTR
jgi:type VI secretion system protein ImpK